MKCNNSAPIWHHTGILFGARVIAGDFLIGESNPTICLWTRMANKKALSFVMLTVFLVSAAASAVLHFKKPKSNESDRLLLLCVSESMEPTVMKGNYILVDKTVGADQIVAAPYPNGDIICYHMLYEDKLAIHRAVEKRVENGSVFFVTKGDNNAVPDQPLPSDNLVGKVVDTNVPLVAMIVTLWSLLLVAVVTGVLCTVLYVTRTEGSASLITA